MFYVTGESHGNARPKLDGWPLVPDLIESRVSPRYLTVKNQASLEYRSGPYRFTTRCTLIDISRLGALVSTEGAIAIGRPLRFRIESPAKTDWIGAVTVRIEDAALIGIRFLQPCQDSLLLAGMLGIELGVSVVDGDLDPKFGVVRIAD